MSGKGKKCYMNCTCIGERQAQEDWQHRGHAALCQDVTDHELSRHQVRRPEDRWPYAGAS